MFLTLLFILLVLTLIASVFAINALVSIVRDRVPYVPAPDWVIGWMVRNIPWEDGKKVFDLGCGDARVLRTIKEQHPGVITIGLERAWWPYVLARWRNRNSGVIIRLKNFHQANLVEADVIFCFLMNSVMGNVEETLRSQVRAGTMIISYAFPFPKWQPTETIDNPDTSKHSKLYIYRT